MFQPQPTAYASFAYGVGSSIPSFAFQSSPLGGGAAGAGGGGIRDSSQSGAPPAESAFLYSTASQPTSFETVSAPATASGVAPHPPPPPPHPPPSTAAAAAAAAVTSRQQTQALHHHHQRLGRAATSSIASHGSSATTTAAAASTSPISPILPRAPQISQHRSQRRPHLHSRAHMRQHHSQRQQHHHSHYALRSQTKMEGNLQQLSDIAAQEALARDYKAQHQGPLVGEKTPSQAITEEYAKADPVYVEKTMALPQTYSHYRPIRGDGNCGWRAIAFAYFEYLVNAADRSLIEAELARLTSTNNFLVQNGYDMSLLEDMVQETLDLLKELASNASNPAAAMGALISRFSDENVDNAIIYHMRMLAAARMKSDPSPYEHFIPGEGGVQEFLQTTIEVPGREIEQIGINLLVKMLLEPAGLALEIAYLDRTPGSEVNTYRFPDSAECQGFPTLCLLFRPDHYDIVYRRPPPSQVSQPPTEPTSLQINRADSFTHNLQIASTPGAMPGFGPVDMGPLATLMASMGGSQTLSPLAPMPQTTPLSEAYSPASQPVWPIVPQYADQIAQAPFQRPLSPAAGPSQPMLEAGLDRQVRFSKYNYRELVDNLAYNEPTFQTTAFKNSQYNKAHYNNPNFQPEEYNPNEDAFERGGHKKKGCRD